MAYRSNLELNLSDGLTAEINQLTLSLNQNSPMGLDGDEVFQAHRSPSDELKYKSKLPSLYANELLSSIQMGIMSIFQKKYTSPSLVALQKQVNSLMKMDISEFFLPFYEERILKKGMFKLREDLKDKLGKEHLKAIADIWNSFYTELLPNIQLVLCHVPVKGGLSIRDRTLLVFRNEMLLKTEIKEYLPRLTQEDGDDSYVSKSRTLSAIRQMCLILLSLKGPPDSIYKSIVELCSRLVTPLMTQTGVIYNGNLPQSPQRSRSIKLKKVKSAGNLFGDSSKESLKTFTLPRMVQPPTTAHVHSRQRSQPVSFLKDLFSTSSSPANSITEDRLSPRVRTLSQGDLV